jgi:organizing structure protein 2
VHAPSCANQLPIYPAPEPEIVLIETPTELERQIGVARTHATAVYADGHAQVQAVVSRWIGVEHAVEGVSLFSCIRVRPLTPCVPARVKALVAPDEPLTPGVLYVAVAALTGSVLARNRGIAARALLPPTLLALAAAQFLPKTSANVREYASDLEDTYLPTVAEKHEIAKAHSAMAFARAQDGLRVGYTRAEAALRDALARVQDTTGLKVKDAAVLGRDARAEAHAVTQKVKEVAVAAESQAVARAHELVNVVRESAAAAEKDAVKIADAAERKVDVAERKVEKVVDAAERKVEQPPKRLV